jgi:kumamolisin
LAQPPNHFLSGTNDDLRGVSKTEIEEVFMKNSLFKSLLLLTLCLDASAAFAAQPPKEKPSVRLSNHVPTKTLSRAMHLNRLDGSTNVPLTIVLPLRNQQELEQLIARIHDPADHEHYGKYLTSAQFVERFAPSQEDYDKVVTYVEGLGLTVENMHANRTLLTLSGDAKSIESAFNFHLHEYMSPEGQKFYAPNNNPQVPFEIASVMKGIVGLDNHSKWKPYRKRKEMASASSVGSRAFPSGPGGGFAPKDIVKAYNLSGVSANGSNQVIALFELAGYQASDINAYTAYFGLPAPKLTNVIVDGGSSDGIDAEVTLDIELALALAPESEIYVYEGPNSNQGVIDTYNRIATDNIAKQVSTSWGMGEDLEAAQYLQAENAIFQQMAVQGQTIYAAAGDSGAYDDYQNNSSTALVVDDPASQPYVVGVGGTRLTVNPNTGAYQMESVWNNGVGNGAGGGGVSKVWPIPSWQKNVSGVYSMSNRNVPDVALDADPNTGYAIYFEGQWQIFGGTSCAAPLWAAFTACVNQSLAEAKKPSLGFANPILYAIANSGMAYAADFHDVTTGNNLFYSAGPGYDNASGWGSFNGSNLFASLTGSTPTPPPPPVTAPVLSVALKHDGPFTRGKIGTYRIVVSNTGNAPTSAPVTLAITLPTGLTYVSSSAPGWVFHKNTLTFTESSALNPGMSYPTIVLNVNVAKNAPVTVTPTATVSGGGNSSCTAKNLTTTH